MRNGLGYLSSLPDITRHATREQNGNHLQQSFLPSAPLTSSKSLGGVYPCGFPWLATTGNCTTS